jgi:hypothetical protein
MTTLSSGTVQVLTFKEGILSPIAHDLRLTLLRFQLDIDDSVVSGRFYPESLTVDGAMRAGRLDPGLLSASQKLEILENVRELILDTRRCPEILLDGRLQHDLAGYELDGELELCGRRQSIRISAKRREGRVQGELELTPSRWGIKPFRALLGAIRLQDRVLVRFDLPEP